MSSSSCSQVPAQSAIPSIFHSASSRCLKKARATTPASPASSSALFGVTQEQPTGDYSSVGERFEVNFGHVYRQNKLLESTRLSYRVRHKSQLNSNRELAPIWRYGLWLCRQCHLSRTPNDAKTINGTAYITQHLRSVHRIDPATGLLPESPTPSRFSSPFEAAKVAGSGTVISHTPWQEDAL
ncbi:hypothetical protein CC86DRAFT_293655 [Ophiobolus disseminans]|uniref:BED-type domain-containing protein n=1 Tax=Ophiobolus disseminans TaxID=1469910 RepID=A0A6A7A039_9PLEO|nr:hypothetical protein CC86DRAFT_293655 [Ophiobolus disseminans]